MNKLLLACQKFRKLAAGNDLAAMVSATKNSCLAEIAGGIKAIDTLSAKEFDAAASKGIQALDEAFGKLASFFQTLTADNLESNLRTAQGILSGAAFYTSPYNAGVGFDPTTRIGGPSSPAAYMDRVSASVKKLSDFLKQTAPIK